MYRVACWEGILALLAVARAGGGGTAPPACDPLPAVNLAAVQRRLTAAESLWQRQGRVAYGLTADVQGQLSFSVAVQVSGSLVTGRITTEQVRLPGKPAAAPVTRQASVAASELYTVAGLFAQVRHALKRARQTGACGILDVTFDSEDGHLLALRNDASAIIDDEFTVITSPLLPLP